MALRTLTLLATFILRGVTLAGIDSVMCDRLKRVLAWEQLSRGLDLSKLDSIINEIPLADVISAAPELLNGKIRGRVVVPVSANAN